MRSSPATTVSAVENERGFGRHQQVGTQQTPLVAMSAAKARALTMGSKQLWSEYSAASKQTPNGFRKSCEREAWPNNSLQQAPGGRSATPRRSSAQGRMRANAR